MLGGGFEQKVTNGKEAGNSLGFGLISINGF
jgi:hypothetical protein